MLQADHCPFQIYDKLLISWVLLWLFHSGISLLLLLGEIEMVPSHRSEGLTPPFPILQSYDGTGKPIFKKMTVATRIVREGVVRESGRSLV